jgi:hypothetical protein
MIRHGIWEAPIDSRILMATPLAKVNAAIALRRTLRDIKATRTEISPIGISGQIPHSFRYSPAHNLR